MPQSFPTEIVALFLIRCFPGCRSLCDSFPEFSYSLFWHFVPVYLLLCGGDRPLQLPTLLFSEVPGKGFLVLLMCLPAGFAVALQLLQYQLLPSGLPAARSRRQLPLVSPWPGPVAERRANMGLGNSFPWHSGNWISSTFFWYHSNFSPVPCTILCLQQGGISVWASSSGRSVSSLCHL